MQLSILLPTNRHGPATISRIAQVCSWASSDIEVIVRDNSGNPEKRALIAHFCDKHCRIISVDPCSSLENYSEILRLASGDFVFYVADDDQCFDRAVRALPNAIDLHGKDPSVAGFTGTYALETPQGTAIVNYKNTDSADPATRVAGYLNYPGPNMLFYSVVRRSLGERMTRCMNALPVFLSFHDQILCLLQLLNGKFVRIPHLLYAYDLGVWGEAESAQKCDAEFYRTAGLDLATNKLHWLICGFEGAALVMNSDVLPEMTSAKRQPIADLWFSMMFARFNNHVRLTFGSGLAATVDKACDELRRATHQLTFEKILSEICGILALSSQDRARAYFDFWSEMISRHHPLLRKSA